jgi:hypothetical protein
VSVGDGAHSWHRRKDLRVVSLLPLFTGGCDRLATAVATTVTPEASQLEDEMVVCRAADMGFRLLQYETDNGQLVWEWRRGNEPRPQFVTRRVAIHWMIEFLDGVTEPVLQRVFEYWRNVDEDLGQQVEKEVRTNQP